MLNFIKRLLFLSDKQTAPVAASIPEFSDCWKCPSCAALLKKGLGGVVGQATIVGVATCLRCQSTFNQADVYDGKYDVPLKVVDSKLRFAVGPEFIIWGTDHSLRMADPDTPARRWLFDGQFLQVDRKSSEQVCTELIKSHYAPAKAAWAATAKLSGTSPASDENIYDLAIKKLMLSYAVRMNVSWNDAESAIKRVMRW